jgi:hypothetical protein
MSRSKGCRHSLCTTVSQSRIRPNDLPPYQAYFQWPRRGRSEDHLALRSARSPPSNERANRSSSSLWYQKREHSCRLPGRMHIQGTRTSPILQCPRSEGSLAGCLSWPPSSRNRRQWLALTSQPSDVRTAARGWSCRHPSHLRWQSLRIASFSWSLLVFIRFIIYNYYITP